VVELRKTHVFVRWIDGLTDNRREDGFSLALSVLRVRLAKNL
jgi:hypothetical protein